MKKKVVVGLSGGVDSSVAAYLLKKQGYEVYGVTMDIWKEGAIDTVNGGCLGAKAKEDAARVAETLGIPYKIVDVRERFRENVMDYFADSYKNGETPNPCTLCNRKVKWEALFKGAELFGAEYTATGHYAKIRQLPNGRYTIANSHTAAKDQTYALCNLTQEQLKRTLLPIGDYEKSEVRRIAKEAGIEVASKPDSMEVCFIPDGDYVSYLEKEYGIITPKGIFIDTEGNVLGEHRGIVHYTIGQRKGLGIAFGKPMFVREIRPETNEVVLSDNEGLFAARVVAENINFMAETREEIERLNKIYLAKIRYNHRGGECRLSFEDDKIIADFLEPQRASAPGQTLVVYNEAGEVVCGGKIIRN